MIRLICLICSIILISSNINTLFACSYQDDKNVSTYISVTEGITLPDNFTENYTYEKSDLIVLPVSNYSEHIRRNFPIIITTDKYSPSSILKFMEKSESFVLLFFAEHGQILIESCIVTQHKFRI